MKIEIKHRTGFVIYTHDIPDNTTRKTVEAAVAAGVDLDGSDLYGADLAGAQLYQADPAGISTTQYAQEYLQHLLQHRRWVQRTGGIVRIDYDDGTRATSDLRLDLS